MVTNVSRYWQVLMQRDCRITRICTPGLQQEGGGAHQSLGTRQQGSILQGTRSGSVHKNTWTPYVTYGAAHVTRSQCQDSETMPFVWLSSLLKECCNAKFG